VKGIFMPGSPAWPQNSARTDQPNAASVPTEMRVSIVAAPWRRLSSAARWNGQAPQITTGAVMAEASHCQLRNCSAGIIDMASTGTVNARVTSTRWRSASAVSSRRRPLPSASAVPPPSSTSAVADE
jgi:hypothetical protein